MLESVQKLAPWLGTLPVMYKFLLSLIGVGVTAVFLLLIWVPIPAVPSAASEDQDPLLVAFKIAEAIGEQMRRSAASREAITTSDAFPDESEQVRNLLRGVQSISMRQSALYEDLRLLAQQVEGPDSNYHDPEELLAYIQGNIPGLIERVEEVIRRLDRFDGRFNYTKMETFSALGEALAKRQRLYRRINQLRLPLSDSDREYVLALADSWESIYKNLWLTMVEISEYLNELEASSTDKE